MNFTADFIIAQAKTAGLSVYATDARELPGHEDDERTLTRISYEGQTLVIVTSWNGRSEQIVAARSIFDGETFRADFSHVDNFTGARAYAMLGWVVTEVADMADRKLADERRAAERAQIKAEDRKVARAVRKGRPTYLRIDGRRMLAA